MVIIAVIFIFLEENWPCIEYSYYREDPVLVALEIVVVAVIGVDVDVEVIRGVLFDCFFKLSTMIVRSA